MFCSWAHSVCIPSLGGHITCTCDILSVCPVPSVNSKRKKNVQHSNLETMLPMAWVTRGELSQIVRVIIVPDVPWSLLRLRKTESGESFVSHRVLNIFINSATELSPIGRSDHAQNWKKNSHDSVFSYWPIVVQHASLVNSQDCLLPTSVV